MLNNNKTIVRFLRSAGIYSAGETPTLDEREALRLAEKGDVEIIGNANDPLAQAALSKPAAPAQAPLGTSPIKFLGKSGSIGNEEHAKTTKPPRPTRPSSRRDAAPQNTRNVGNNADADDEG